MEPSLLIALVMAFGIRLDSGGGTMPHELMVERLWETGLLLVGQAGLALVLGQLLRRRARRAGVAGGSLRRPLALCGRSADVLTLGVFAYILYELGWPDVVERGLGLRGAILGDEILILAPYLIGRLTSWWGLYPAERAIRGIRARDAGTTVGLLSYLGRRARQSFGLVLPATLIYCLGSDLIERWSPGATESPYAPLVGMVLMGALVLIAAPALVRLAWPTRRLPPGPLRDRLERLARRLGFRYSDILVWDTGGSFVNAGVTGAVPWYRYVLLTDTLVENLDQREIEAVFGHEIGHIAHRHLAYFGLFFVGTLGVMALMGQGVHWLLDARGSWLSGPARLDLSMLLAVKTTAFLACLGLYFLLVFGFLSRRFERQADVYGCRAVSCGRMACPPHFDLNAAEDDPLAATATICPVGIRIFANALANVALLNGMEPRARSWRHGSIARRIAFLEGLEGRPDRERRFQASIRWMRLALAVGLIGAVLIAEWTHALEQF